MPFVNDQDDDAETGSEQDGEGIERVLEQLRAENHELRKNFEQLKGFHIQLSAAHKELQSKHGALFNERHSVERQYQQLCESWRLELEDKQKQFDQVKAQLLQPRDLDVLKAKLLEEVEAPYKMKCDILTREAESAQESFVRLRREHETLQNTYHNLELRMSSEMEAQEAEHRLALNALRDKVAAMGEPQARLAQLELKLRGQQREKYEDQVTIQKLQEEMTDLRKQKESAVVERESVMIKAEKQLKQLQANELELQSLVESLTRKCRHLNNELAESTRVQEACHTQMVALQGQVASLHDQLDSVKRQAAADKQVLMDTAAREEKQTRERIKQLEDELADRDKKLTSAMRRQQEGMVEAADAAAARVSDVEQKLQARIKELTLQKASLQAQLERVEAAQPDVARVERQAQSMLETAQRDLATARQEASEAGRQANDLRKQLTEARSSVDALKTQLIRLENGEGAAWLSRRDEVVERASSLERKVEELQEALEERAQEVLAVRQQLEKERLEQVEYIQSARQVWAAEKSAVVRHGREKLKQASEEHAAERKKWKLRLRQLRHAISALHEELTGSKVQVQELQDTARSKMEMLELAASSRAGSPGGRERAAAMFGRSSSPSGSPEKLFSTKLAELSQRQTQYLSQPFIA